MDVYELQLNLEFSLLGATRFYWSAWTTRYTRSQGKLTTIPDVKHTEEREFNIYTVRKCCHSHYLFSRFCLQGSRGIGGKPGTPGSPGRPAS